MLQVLHDFGFPVFCCVALGLWATKQDGLARVERAAWRSTIDAGTAALNSLSEALRDGMKR